MPKKPGAPALFKAAWLVSRDLASKETCLLETPQNLGRKILPNLRSRLDLARIVDQSGIKTVTFVSPVNYAILRKEDVDLGSFDAIAVDGISLAWLYSLLFRRSISRQSFDMSSVGRDVLTYANDNSLKLVPIGATDQEVTRFVERLSKAYPRLSLPAAFSGYFSDDGRAILAALSEIKPDIVIIGMGSPRQERLACSIKQQVHGTMTVFTCGAFISQYAARSTYYPKLVDKLHLRWAHRLICEPHTRNRFLRLFFPGLFLAAADVFCGGQRWGGLQRSDS